MLDGSSVVASSVLDGSSVGAFSVLDASSVGAFSVLDASSVVAFSVLDGSSVGAFSVLDALSNSDDCVEIPFAEFSELSSLKLACPVVFDVSSAFASFPIPNTNVAPINNDAVPTVNLRIEYLFCLFGKKSNFFPFIYIPPQFKQLKLAKYNCTTSLNLVNIVLHNTLNIYKEFTI